MVLGGWGLGRDVAGRRKIPKLLHLSSFLGVCGHPRGLGQGGGSDKATVSSSEVVGRRDAVGSRKGLMLVPCGGEPPAGTQLAGDGRKEPGLLGEVSRVFENHPDGSMAQIRDQNQVGNTRRI